MVTIPQRRVILAAAGRKVQPAGILLLNCEAYYVASDAGGSDGGAVAVWADISHNGRHMTAENGSPTFRLTGVNNKPSVQFDGNDSFQNASLGSPFSGSDLPLTIIALIQQTSTAGNQYVVSFAPGGGAVLRFGHDAGSWVHFRRDDSAGQDSAVGGAPNTNLRTVAMVYAPDTATIWLDGTDTTTDNNVTVGTCTVAGASLGFDRHGGQDYFLGHICEIGFWSRALTTTERSNIEQDMLSRYP